MAKPVLLLISAAALACAWRPCVGQAELALPARSAEFSGWQRMGLMSPWTSVVQFDRTTDRLRSIQVSMQGDAKYPIYEVVSERGREGFSSRDTNRLGVAIGDREARRRAEQRVRDLVAMGYQASSQPGELTEVRVYAQSDHGTLQAIDGESGRTLWTVPLGPRNGRYYPIFARDKILAAVSGTKVLVIDAGTGSELWSAEVRGVPIAGPALTDTVIVVPLLGGFVDCYEIPQVTGERGNGTPAATPLRAKPIARFVASGYVTASPSILRNFLAWGTDRGVVSVATLQPGQLKFRLHASPIASDLVFRNGNELIVADRHGYVQSLDVTKGSTRWQTSTGKQIVRAPVSVGDNIYVATQRDGTLCLDAVTGETKWQATSVAAVCSVSKDAVYGLDYFGALRKLRLDNGTTVAIGSRESNGVVVTNPTTDRVYLADAVGRLVCLRESGQAWPRFHQLPSDEVPAPEKKEDVVTPPTDSTPSDVEPTIEPENPFLSEESDSAEPGGTPTDDTAPAEGDGDSISPSEEDVFDSP